MRAYLFLRKGGKSLNLPLRRLEKASLLLANNLYRAQLLAVFLTKRAQGTPYFPKPASSQQLFVVPGLEGLPPFLF